LPRYLQISLIANIHSIPYGTQIGRNKCILIDDYFRVKELKGDYEDVNGEENNSEPEIFDNSYIANEMEDDLLDNEFPPENFSVSSHQSTLWTCQKPT